MQRYLPLICLALLHTLVDTCALLVAPLWPRLEQVYSFGLVGLSIAFIVQSMPTSISQAVFGYLRDRRSAPMWLWLGPVFAAVFLTAIGLTDQRYVLFALLVLGGIGVGAFHPEAAVIAGRQIPGQRARGLSVFMFGGSLGLAFGPIISGIVVGGWQVSDSTTIGGWGLSGLLALTVPVLLLIAVLTRVGRLYESPAQEQPETSERPSVQEMLHGKAGFAVLMLVVCSLRLVPNMAMDKVLAFTLRQPHWNYDETMIGIVQSVFLIAASVGMFLMMFLFRAGLEKTFMVGCPLCGIPLMLILGWDGCPAWLLISTLAVAGMVLWGTSPAMVSYAQQQFPKGAGLASALTMGMAWGIGGLIQAPITSWFQKAGTPQMTFWAAIPFLALAGGISFFLPGTPAAEREAEHSTSALASAQPAAASD